MRSISNRNSGASNVFNLANGERAPCFLLTPSTFKVFWPTSRMLNLKMMISGCGSSNPKVDFGCGPLLSKFGGCVVGFLGVSYDGCFVYRLNWHCDPLGALVSDWAATHMCVANCVLIHGLLGIRGSPTASVVDSSPQDEPPQPKVRWQRAWSS